MKKKFPFHIGSSHIWFVVEIKWLISIWNARLPWYEPSSSSSSLQCKDKQLRLLQFYTKIEDPSKVLNQMCDVKWGRLLWTVLYPKECLNTKSSKLHGTEHDQHVINYREAFFFQNQIQFRYQPGIKCLCVTFIHHFVKSFSGTFYLTLFFQGITESMLSFQHLN